MEHWRRPELDLHEALGHRGSNVLLTPNTGGAAVHNLSPFLDPRKDTPDSERYKALGGDKENLCAFASGDGIHWDRIGDGPVITTGYFDSQNVAFWDGEREEYRAYTRDFNDGRDIRTCTSKDFDPGIPELSFFVSEGSFQPTHARLRRYSIRLDGFVSVWAPLRGGEVLTRPLLFSGNKLLINYSTGAAGSVRVEVQDRDGVPIPGYTIEDAEEMFGDSLEQPVLWRHGFDVGSLQGKPVKLRFVLADADLYSLRFC